MSEDYSRISGLLTAPGVLIKQETIKEMLISEAKTYTVHSGKQFQLKLELMVPEKEGGPMWNFIIYERPDGSVEPYKPTMQDFPPKCEMLFSYLKEMITEDISKAYRKDWSDFSTIIKEQTD